jgi:hypothetical protein
MNQENPENNEIIPSSAKPLITPGDMSKGMFVVIYDAIPIKEQVASFMGVVEVEHKPKGAGLILEIKAMRLPFIIVDQYDTLSKQKHRYQIDTRSYHFMELDKDYIKILLEE